MKKERRITEAYCYDCNRVWSSRDFYRPEEVGKKHADETRHHVRVIIHIIRIYNQNGNGRKVKQ